MRRTLQSLAIATLTLSGAAHAGLVGTTVGLTYLYPDAATVFTTDSIVVDATAIEVTCTGGGAGNANICAALTAPNQSLNFTDTTIDYTYTGTGSGFNPAAWSGFDFDVNPGFTLAGVNLVTNIVGLDASRLSFTGNSIELNMQGLVLAGGVDFFSLELVAAAVPEPSSISLLLAAALGAAACRRRATVA